MAIFSDDFVEILLVEESDCRNLDVDVKQEVFDSLDIEELVLDSLKGFLDTCYQKPANNVGGEAFEECCVLFYVLQLQIYCLAHL